MRPSCCPSFIFAFLSSLALIEFCRFHSAACARRAVTRADLRRRRLCTRPLLAASGEYIVLISIARGFGQGNLLAFKFDKFFDRLPIGIVPHQAQLDR